MIIISHRGAAGILPENTIPSIEAAVTEGVDMIEFDVQATKDGHLVVFHDDTLSRMTGVDKKISELTYKEISMTATYSGHPIPSFAEAMEAAGNIPVLIDGKGKNWAKLVLKALKNHKGPIPAVTGRDRSELIYISQKRPEIETYISELTKPFDAAHLKAVLSAA